jgi:hypothetical protein
MIPTLSINDKLNMSLSQINRYEKKYTKLRHNNRYYISHYGYDVALEDWSIHVDGDDYIYAKGYLGNDNGWTTSGILSMETVGNYYRCTTESGTVYRLYF